ncbi:uncharacterized protein P174DRAFT_437578 [Aspergillus novofumigatus IBT 16806]|uniref:Uncharacterized protein n=1 Tax=Aspergillus novofumigatus (strain IBT 16806) TaxID=1392255 RepID=A0A2I1CNC6_ASPN1|nr:uncharacterized protein P174DRAFT_437578 [Aspergillus novofumigatus IBT 16806]PKX99133.1 hypothetical protein P174DRAFT_437578 [Aspergillus novofumigatus IBT 16806]
MKQDKTSMPYAWYWHGKPLRTGIAQGEKIGPVCTGSHILQTSDHCTPDRPCCPANIPDRSSCPCGHGHGHGHGSNAENHHWIPEQPPQNPNSCSPGVQRRRHCGPEGQQDQIPRCSAPTFTCQGCPHDTPRPEPCPLDRCCIAENTCLPGDPYCQTPQDMAYPASRCNFCSNPKPEMHCGDSTRTRNQHQSEPVKCQQSFTRFESCDRFDCCEDTFFSKCEYSTEESMETGHGHGHGQDTDFETRSYHRRRPWVNHQLHRKY